ncbi:type I methionyl aminopeptidase [Cytobacillus depressus]|uniref:Methionine aminopeptidase n=1 Tax=Cytobacillus depressus TaxID=1602942 RepID=A0A6L3V7D5_9BACI|nr:type I methionyl aminopeptidase [Cytobacillus depressus]KAB2336620.1 type I methionyl aminopeptidase [Cytobacillus depressus]
MITLKSQREIDMMTKTGQLLADTHKQVAKMIKPGVTTWEIEEFVDGYLRKHGAISEQIGYRGYKYAICASINDEVCHGFPRKTSLKEGDIVTIDTVVNLNGYLADSAWSYPVGKVSDLTQKLLDVTKEALYKGIDQVKVGNRIGDIGFAIQTYVEAQGFSVVRDFIGHGIGPTIHEDPKVPNYGLPGKGPRIREGMVFTIEPMVNIGGYETKMDNNGWTARTRDGSLSAQYEHTIAVTKDGIFITTSQED